MPLLPYSLIFKGLFVDYILYCFSSHHTAFVTTLLAVLVGDTAAADRTEVRLKLVKKALRMLGGLIFIILIDKAEADDSAGQCPARALIESSPYSPSQAGGDRSNGSLVGHSFLIRRSDSLKGGAGARILPVSEFLYQFFRIFHSVIYLILFNFAIPV